ncbi:MULTISPECIES: hypothetical protein [Mycolicibacterium]|nr:MULTISPECIES: hypothetical protein [Mycolicibacterium]MDX1886914.1 hypothetical protein [Mycolicibacterium sp. 120270]
MFTKQTLLQRRRDLAMASESTAPRKSRSGSSNRQRNEQVKLNLLPTERQRLQQLADRGGYQNVQAYIMDKLQPDLALIGGAAAAS